MQNNIPEHLLHDPNAPYNILEDTIDYPRLDMDEIMDDEDFILTDQFEGSPWLNSHEDL